MLTEALTELQEQVIGINKVWFERRGKVELESEILLGREISSRLTKKRSAMVAKSRKSGAEAR